jgi:hypothetical protein
VALPHWVKKAFLQLKKKRRSKLPIVRDGCTSREPLPATYSIMSKSSSPDPVACTAEDAAAGAAPFVEAPASAVPAFPQ